MNITVIRDTGDKVGPSVSDSLLTTTTTGIERGRVEIDSQYYDKINTKTRVTEFQYLSNGSFISTLSSNIDSEVVLLTGISISYKAGEPPAIEIETERLTNGL